MAENKTNIKTNELVCLILMLIPIISIVAGILYCLWTKPRGLKLLVAILSIIFGFIPCIFLWLDAFSVLEIDNKPFSSSDSE